MSYIIMFLFQIFPNLKIMLRSRNSQNNKKWLISDFLNFKNNVEIRKFSLFKIMFTYWSYQYLNFITVLLTRNVMLIVKNWRTALFSAINPQSDNLWSHFVPIINFPGHKRKNRIMKCFYPTLRMIKIFWENYFPKETFLYLLVQFWFISTRKLLKEHIIIRIWQKTSYFEEKLSYKILSGYSLY